MDSRVKILLRYVARYRTGYLLGFAGLIFNDIFWLLRPRVVGQAIDSLAAPTPAHPLLWYIAVFMGLVVGENIFRVLWRLSLMGASRHIERDLLNDFFGHLLRLDPKFFDRTPTGDLMARATNDIVSVRMFLGPGTMALFDTVVVFAMTFAFMMSLSVKLTLYALLPMPFLAVFMGYLLRNVHNSYDRVQAQFSTMSKAAQERISGIRVIKAHNREQAEINAYDKVATDYVSKYMHLTKFESAIEPVILFVASIGIVITLFVGGNAVMQGQLTLGQLVQFFLYLMTLTWPVIAIGWGTNLFERGMASLGRIRSILQEKPTISSFHPEQDDTVDSSTPRAEASATDQQPGFINGDIELRNVSFRYTPDSSYALKDVNLRIKEGETLGIVGPMGSGKTTLLNLIARLYDPDSGEVRIGGNNIKSIPVHALRQHVGFVPQEPFLFSRNIRENVNLGHAHQPLAEHEVETALEMADIHNEVQGFPQGLQSNVGERGVSLSGGQKQRMTIARALAKQSQILILDDTLSSVDSHTEERIINNVKEFARARTNIVVSHRISSVKDADHIIVLKDGEIIEQGTHPELLQQQGFYWKIYQQQLFQEQLEES